jgi:hypothetical protein
VMRVIVVPLFPLSAGFFPRSPRPHAASIHGTPLTPYGRFSGPHWLGPKVGMNRVSSPGHDGQRAARTWK